MKTIVWDVDDVLNDLMYQWFVKRWLTDEPDCPVDYSGLIANPPHEQLRVAKDRYLQSIDQFRSTADGIDLTPNALILDWFKENGAGFRHVALTARPLVTSHNVAEWTIRHFGYWIRCFGVAPQRVPTGAPVYENGKGEYLRWLNIGDIIVDDSPDNLDAAAEVGLQTFLWPQPWNKPPFTARQILDKLTELA